LLSVEKTLFCSTYVDECECRRTYSLPGCECRRRVQFFFSFGFML